MNANFLSREFKSWSTVRGARRVWLAVFNWRMARRAALSLAALLTLVASFHAVENWRGRRAWEQLKSEMKARGEPTDPAAVIPPPVPDAENFAVAPLWRELVGDDYRKPDATTNEWLHIYARIYRGPAVPKSDWRKGELTDLADWQRYFREVQAEAFNPAATDVFPIPAQPGNPAEDVLLALGRFDRHLAELREAARRAQSRFPLRYEDGMLNMMLPHLGYLQSASAFLRLRALAELELSRSDDALADLQLGFRLMSAIETEPTLISHLVRLAMADFIVSAIWQGTVDHRWTEAQLAVLDGQLRRVDFLADYERAFRAETIWSAQNMDAFCASRDGRFLFGPVDTDYTRNTSERIWEKVSHWMPAGWFDQNKVALVRVLSETGRLRAQPSAEHIDLAERKGWMARRDAAFSKRRPYNFLAGWMGAVYGELSLRSLETIAHLRLARAACALERHRLARGEFPASLGELAPAYIDAVPRDVIDGGKLKYRRSPDGSFVLYSPGWNGVDDNGSVALFTNSSVDRKQGDWVWPSPGR